MKIAIVDDSEEMLDKIEECVIQAIGTANSEIRTFSNSNKLLDILETNYRYDLYLLDIEMKQLSGIELAKEIRRQQRDACIIFITSHSDFALTSYDIRIKAYQYVIKDNIEEKLPEILLEVQCDMEKAKTEYYILKNQRHIERIKLEEIVKIYKSGKNVMFVTAEKEHSERKTLNQVMKEINRPEFIFIDKGIIVNIQQIKRIEGSEIYFFNETKVHISRSNIQRVKCRVCEYWGTVL